MASEKRTMYYTEGSVVRKRDVYMAEPARRPQQRPDVQRRPKTYKRAAEKAERSLGVDGAYMVMVSVMMIIMIISCVVMLKIQSDVTVSERRIISLQNQLQTIQSDNIAYENSLNNMYSLEEIYNVATGELGMVYSQNGQVIYYESSQDDYVTQYKDVPETGR